MIRYAVTITLCLSIVAGGAFAQSALKTDRLSDVVDPILGVAFRYGSCVPGACLPHASIYPNPDKLNGRVMEFTMGPASSAWGCGGEFDPALALREINPAK